MTSIHLSVFVVSLAGFVALALAMPEHSRQILRKTLAETRRRPLRLLGWALLALAVALSIGIAEWHFDVGIVTWLGWLTVAGVALAFYLPNWPWSVEPRRERRSVDKTAPETPVTGRRPPGFRSGLAVVVLLLPPAGFTWQLLSAPEKPLLREDAVQGQIGPWTFTLAEMDRSAPVIAAMDVPLKKFVIRFCEGCEKDIRGAYLKVREPRSVRAAGNAFKGRGPEKIVEIPLPRAATLDDGLWLTVESNTGEVYHQQFDIRRLSPALAGMIEDRS